MAVTFFGHRDCPTSIKPTLFQTIKEEIERGTNHFYIGNHGNFDTMALSCLRELKQTYSDIQYAVVLAYLPYDSEPYLPGETILPEGIEIVPKRFAIDYRNRWMLDHADTVITYVLRPYGGAAKYVEKANHKNKTVINLVDWQK